MRILFVSDGYVPEVSAAASRVHDQARFWVEQGHEVTVLTSVPNAPLGRPYEGYQNRWFQEERVEGVRVWRVKTYMAPNRGRWRRILDYLSFVPSALWHARHMERPDVLIATSPQFFAAVAGMLLAKHWGIPWVMQVADLWPDSVVGVGAMRPGFWIGLMSRLELAMYHSAEHIILLSPAFLEVLRARGVPESKMHVIMNGVRQDLFYPRARETLDAQRWGLPPDAFVFAYIGTHGMAHDLSRFLGMAARFQVSHPQVYFLFVGEGAEKNQLMAQAQSLGLSHCIFLPKQDKADIPKIWSCVDVALVSLREDPVLATAMPSKIFEAMAMGKPVFFKGPQGVASSFIEREGIGQCDLGSNPEAMYDFMLQFLDPLRYTAWSEAALKAVPRYRREAQAMAGLRVLASCL